MPLAGVRVVALLVGLGFGAGMCAWADDYRLGPQDRLQIKVYDLRPGTGEAHEWTALQSEFTVSASGHVALPLVGELDVDGRTTSDLARDIAAGLQARVGLAVPPDASVQVVRYRPFYVVGSVDKPGEYEYRPALTVLQAIGVAGGLERVAGDALLGLERDSVTTRGDLRVLSADRLSLLARQARLAAEIGGAVTIAVPDELHARDADPNVALILREEQMLFEARRHALQSQTAAIEQTKAVLAQEVTSLARKDQALEHQLDVMRQELAQVTGLVAKGLAVLPRQLDMEQTTAQLESNRLDIALATLRAQQDISKADRDILELRNARSSEALQEATEVRNRLTETTEKIATAERMIWHVEVRAPTLVSELSALKRDPDYFITRRSGGATATVAAQEDDLVQPGDVVRVVPRIDAKGSPSGMAAADAPRAPKSNSPSAF